MKVASLRGPGLTSVFWLNGWCGYESDHEAMPRKSPFAIFLILGPSEDYSGDGLQRPLHARPRCSRPPASRNRPDWSDDDYNVVLMDTGKPVGRIFLRTVAPGTLM